MLLKPCFCLDKEVLAQGCDKSLLSFYTKETQDMTIWPYEDEVIMLIAQETGNLLLAIKCRGNVLTGILYVLACGYQTDITRS